MSGNRFTRGDVHSTSGGYGYPAYSGYPANSHSHPNYQSGYGHSAGWQSQDLGQAFLARIAQELGYSSQTDYKAEALMRHFHQEIDKTNQTLQHQSQRVTALEDGTANLLESQANAHKRVQVLSEGITRQEMLQQEQARKLYAPLPVHKHH